MVFLNAPELVSASYATAAEAAVRDRWSNNDPNAPWMTKAEVEKQLGEIADAGAIGQDDLNDLMLFYRKRLS